MKILMLAALAIAVPAIAQDMPPPTPQTTPADPAPAEPMPADPGAPTPAQAPAPAAPAAAPTGDGTTGGYGPATTAPIPSGATVRFQQAPTPDQAFPAPAPLAKYPVCKKGQYDKCIQRGGK